MANEVNKLIFKADTKQIKKASDDLNKLGKSAGTADKGAKKASSSFQSAGKSAGAMRAKVAGAAAAFTALALAARSSVSAFSSYEQQMNRLSGLIRTTGGVAGLTAEELDGLAKEIGRSTLSSAAGIRDAAGILLTFKNISGDTFRSTLRLTQDLAEILQTDAKSAAMQFGKALNDPAKGVSMLNRAGISFTDTQLKMIKGFQESGDLASAQGVILEEISGQMSGTAVAAAQGLAGELDNVSEAWTDMMIALGEGSAGKAVAGVASALTSFFDLITEISVTNEEARVAQLRGIVDSTNIWVTDSAKEQARAELKIIDAKHAAKLEQEQLAAQNEAAAREKADAAARAAQEQKEIAHKNAQDAEFARLQEHHLRLQGLEAEANEIAYQAAIDRATVEKDADLQKYADKEAVYRAYREKLAIAEEEFNIAEDERKQARKDEQDEKDAEEKELKAELDEANHLELIANNDAFLATMEKAKKGELKLEDMTAKQKKKMAIGAGGQMLTLLSKNSEKAFKVQKAAGIANAVISGYESATLAWESGMATGGPYAPAIAAAYMAASIAKTAAQINAIKSQTFKGGGSGRAGGGGGGIPSAGGGGAALADSAPVQPAANDEPAVAQREINVTVDGTIDPNGARRIIEAINEATDDGLEINALVGT